MSIRRAAFTFVDKAVRICATSTIAAGAEVHFGINLLAIPHLGELQKTMLVLELFWIARPHRPQCGRLTNIASTASGYRPTSVYTVSGINWPSVMVVSRLTYSARLSRLGLCR